MQIIFNAKPYNISARTLSDALTEMGFTCQATATAVNGEFVPRSARADTVLEPGDRVELISPMQGG